MITRLKKPLTRVIEFPRGPVVVTIHPAGHLTFRGLRKQRRFSLGLEEHFKNAFPPEPQPQLELERVS